MSPATSRGVLVYGGHSARRAEVARECRLVGSLSPVRIASQLAEAMKCLADGAVHCVVVLDEASVAELLQRHVARQTPAITVHVVTTEAELQDALHTMQAHPDGVTDRAIDRP